MAGEWREYTLGHKNGENGVVNANLVNAVFEVCNVDRHPFSATGRQAIEKVRAWAVENLVGERIAHQGTPDEFKYIIETNKDGKDDPIGKMLSASSTTESDNLGVHLAALMDLPKLIDASVEGEYHAGYAKIENKRGAKLETIPVIVHRLYRLYRLYTAMTVKGDPSLYRVKITVKEFRDKKTNLIHTK